MSLATTDEPPAIRTAIETAARTRACEFVTDLQPHGEDEFAIEAMIGPARRPLDAPAGPFYRVRFLMHRSFPYRRVETVPINPPLRWFPHQNGDWSEDPHRNIICPPRMSDVHLDELLLPYVRHAHRWITDALRNQLTPSDELYELPHVYLRSHFPCCYVEGGAAPLQWLARARYGCVRLVRLSRLSEESPVYRATDLRARDGVGDHLLKAGVRAGAFGKEEFVGWTPWVFAGDPVVGKAHRPAVTWSDLRPQIQEDLLRALRLCADYKASLGVALLAFSVPKLWNGAAEAVAWRGLKLRGYEPGVFRAPSKGSFRKHVPLTWFPSVRRFIKRNSELRWIATTDVSEEALTSRAI